MRSRRPRGRPRSLVSDTVVSIPPPKLRGRRPKTTTGVGTKSHGLRDIPPALPQMMPETDMNPQAAIDKAVDSHARLHAIVAQALLSGLGPRVACQLICRQYPEYDPKTTWAMVGEVQESWDHDMKENWATLRASQVARLQQDLAVQRAQLKPRFSDIRGHEELLARITGTLQPIRVEVDVMATLKTSLAAVIVDLSEAEKDQLVAEQMELEDAAARLLPKK